MKMNTLLAWLRNLKLSKLFKLYYGIDLSVNFISCADEQLTKIFEKQTSLKIDNRTRFNTVEKAAFFYEKGQISKLQFTLQLPFASNNIIICWQSKSGRIYDIADEDIDSNDIEFWFENLDVDLCRKATDPKWSLLPEIWQADWITRFEKEYEIKMSASFAACLDKQLSELFTKRTGIKITQKISTTLSHYKVDEPFFTSDTVSKFNTCLIINHNWDPVDVLWQSKSGRIYLPGDEDVDCNDIEFWFEGFDAALYIQQYYPNQKLPFKIKNITYELVVNRISIDCSIIMKLKPQAVADAENIVENIDDFIAAFNDRSEERNRGEGVVHKWNSEIKNDTIIYKLDLGSTGISFFKKILTFLSKKDLFLKVEIE